MVALGPEWQEGARGHLLQVWVGVIATAAAKTAAFKGTGPPPSGGTSAATAKAHRRRLRWECAVGLKKEAKAEIAARDDVCLAM